jgi:hypothetical protein
MAKKAGFPTGPAKSLFIRFLAISPLETGFCKESDDIDPIESGI